ncbi:MAG: imidazolonepropionase [Bacteroidota bacterium]
MTHPKILIKNIRELVQVDHAPTGMATGERMGQLPTLKQAWLAIENGRIADFGSMDTLHGVTDWNNLEVIDADGKMVFPSWCDSHTHTVYAGSREQEFVDRINGLSYAEIAARGGGILNSAQRLREASEEELVASAWQRLEEIQRHGTGAVEIKSGYGLTLESELKMLRVIRQLKEKSPLTIKATLLAAHALPAEYKTNREGYLNLIINDLLPRVADEGLAEYMDVFCETGYFTPEETDRLLEAGDRAGLRAKIHVNQFTAIGGIATAVQHNALSVDHLEVVTPEDLEVLRNGSTIATLLPSCSLFLSIPYAPARDLITANVPVALASDFNPGSTPSGNMSLVVALGCIKLGMTPEEAIQAATRNGAHAMDLGETHGSIAVGKVANLFITNPIPSYAYVPYAFGSNLVETVILNGKVC